MILLWIYLSGCILLGAGNYIFALKDKTKKHTKLFWAYESFKMSLLSWIGILFVLVGFILLGLTNLDSWIRTKLDK